MLKLMDVIGYYLVRCICLIFNCLFLFCVVVNVLGMMVKCFFKLWSLLIRIDCYYCVWSFNWWIFSKGGEDGRFIDLNGMFYFLLLCWVKMFVFNLFYEGLCLVLISFGVFIYLFFLYLYIVLYIYCCMNLNWCSWKMWLFNDYIFKIFEVCIYLSGILYGLFGKKW